MEFLEFSSKNKYLKYSTDEIIEAKKKMRSCNFI